MWVCDVCDEDNPPDAIECESCFSERPEFDDDQPPEPDEQYRQPTQW